ncbi:hypothetical protein ACQ4PT_013281 [Festuca glaucescens]
MAEISISSPDKGLPVEDIPVPGRLPLFLAASSGDDERLQQLLSPPMAVTSEEDSALVVTNEGNSALHVVATDGDGAGHLESAKVIHDKAEHLLLACNVHGDTPLHCAARAGNTCMVSRLIGLAGDAKDMVRVQNKDGKTALHEAIGSDDMQMVQSLMSKDNELARLDANDGTSPLFLAISLGHHSIARQLHQYDNDLSHSGPHGRTALHAAVLHDKRIAKSLLDWTKKNKEKTTNLTKQRGTCESTPMHFAASVEDPSLEFFLFAFVNRSLEICSFSLYYHIAPSKLYRSEFKSIMNIQDKDGNTALHLAIHVGDWDIFRSLIFNQHVLLNLLNKLGETPMDIADSRAPSASGFYFGMHARRRILATLTFADAQNGNSRRDRFMEEHNESREDKIKSDHWMEENERREGKKITDFAQIVGIGSVLVATATFAAAFTMPGGFSEDKETPPTGKGGTPTLAGYYAFDGFVISNTLAFICSSLATFSLIYTGVGALDIHKRIELVSFSLALLMGAARSFCAAFAFALYVLLAPVDRRAAITSCTLTVLAFLDALWFMRAIFTDTALVFKRGCVKLKNNRGWLSLSSRLLRLGTRFLANIAYLFWPYIVIFSLLENRNRITERIKLG